MADVRIKNVVVNVILLLLGVGNAVAAVFEWYDSAGMLIFNGLCVVLLIAAVMHKVFNMEPRKKWRILAFLLSTIGVLAVFCSQFLASDIEPWLMITLLAVGAVLLLLGGISMVCWRRFSFERKEQLQNKRKK
jgi:peptidoglycan/LPS O-acetylase OafA/YrhL